MVMPASSAMLSIAAAVSASTVSPNVIVPSTSRDKRRSVAGTAQKSTALPLGGLAKRLGGHPMICALHAALVERPAKYCAYHASSANRDAYHSRAVAGRRVASAPRPRDLRPGRTG